MSKDAVKAKGKTERLSPISVKKLYTLKAWAMIIS